MAVFRKVQIVRNRVSRRLDRLHCMSTDRHRHVGANRGVGVEKVTLATAGPVMGVIAVAVHRWHGQEAERSPRAESGRGNAPPSRTPSQIPQDQEIPRGPDQGQI